MSTGSGIWIFITARVRVLLANGQWAYPLLLGILDDHSRLCCHAQWYLTEGAEELCHGLSQGFQKRALPRALMSDNGSAMIAAETEQGLARLGIVHETTLPVLALTRTENRSRFGARSKAGSCPCSKASPI